LIKKTGTFDPSAFHRLRNAENTHFWFTSRRKWILSCIKQFVTPPAKILEVGCGTGNVSNFLAIKGFTVIGCELHHEAIMLSWPGFIKIQGDANNLPFQNNSFDIVGLFDIIEHFQDDRILLQEAFRVLKKGGIVVLTVPARKELWSYFDERGFHKKRYTKATLHSLLRGTGLTPSLIEYMFMSLYIPMRFIRGKKNQKINPFEINKLLNTFLKGFFDVERSVSKAFPLPIGTSLIAVAQKST